MFIGSKVTGLYNRHEAETVIRTCSQGGIFGLAKHSVPAGGDVVVNVGTVMTQLPTIKYDEQLGVDCLLVRDRLTVQTP